MISPRSILRLLAVAIACVLTSCIDCHEEFWLAADGSGHADISYTLPAAAARFQGGETGVREMIGKFLADTTAIKSSNYQVTTEAGRLHIRVQAAFDSVMDFKQISTGESMSKLPSSAGNLTGKLEVTRNGRTVDLTRTICAGAALPGAIFMPTSNFEGHRLAYIIHLPVPAAESNATRIEDDGRTLVWDFPLAQAIKGPVATHFTVKVPVPVWMWASTGAASFLAGSFAFFFIRKMRRPKRTA